MPEFCPWDQGNPNKFQDHLIFQEMVLRNTIFFRTWGFSFTNSLNMQVSIVNPKKRGRTDSQDSEAPPQKIQKCLTGQNPDENNEMQLACSNQCGYLP